MSNQVKRIFYIYRKLQSGAKLSTKDIYDDIHDKFNDVSLRSIQRDMILLKDVEPLLESEKSGTEIKYKISKSASRKANVELYSKQIISFYFLKAHLSAFKNTIIEEDVNILSEKLEFYARGEIFDKFELYWDKNPGYYDYTQFDPQIRRVIDAIVSKEWVDVTYESQPESERSIICRLIKMFTYNGSLYAVAYIKHHNSFIALAIQNIYQVNKLYRPPKDLLYHKVPEFDMDEFSKYRFGVFWGEPYDIKLLIDKSYSRYFINRTWHKTQKISFDNKKNMILEMKVPLSPELKSWILSWAEVITVVSPENLKNEIILKAKEFIKRNSVSFTSDDK